jgi:hypothetical protein
MISRPCAGCRGFSTYHTCGEGVQGIPEEPGPSLYKIYDLLMGLYNRDNLGLAYKDGQPLAVNKTCTWCSKGKQEKGKWTGCASDHYGSGCGDKWEGKR